MSVMGLYDTYRQSQNLSKLTNPDEIEKGWDVLIHRGGIKTFGWGLYF